MSSPQQSDMQPEKPAPTPGVWGFMKRKVWGDISSHPVSDSGSESHRATEDEQVDHSDRSGTSIEVSGQADMAPVDSRQLSPFQSHRQASLEDESDEESRQEQATGSNKTSTIASELSLRHGLGEGYYGQHSFPVDTMNRQPSLAAGISGAGFEWSPSPSRTPTSVPSDSNTEPHLTFASAPADDDSNSRPAQSASATQSQAGTGADTSAFIGEAHSTYGEDTAGEDTAGEDQAEGSSMSADITQAEEAGAGSLFSPMQTRAPGLTPLRLTPKTKPAQPRLPNPPAPTSFPTGAVAAQGGATPTDIQQSEEEEQRHVARHGADLTPSPRTGAIVDELLQGVVFDNFATGDSSAGAPDEAQPQQRAALLPASEPKPQSHGALQVGPAPSESEPLSHDAAQVVGLSDDTSGALRIPQPGGEATPHGALQVEAMPKPEPLPDLAEDASSPRSARSGTASSPRSPVRAAVQQHVVDCTETAIGLTGGAVAGPVAASALVGIGAAAIAGGAVLDAVNFPHSPERSLSPTASGESTPVDEAAAAAAAEHAQQQPQASDASSSLDKAAGAQPDQRQHQASGSEVPVGRSPAESAEQHKTHDGDTEMATDSTTNRPHGLEHASSGAKRHADRGWSDLGSPMKRQELEQQSTSAFGPAAVTTAGRDTAMTHAFESVTAPAADDTSADGAVDCDAAMTHSLVSDIASAADDKGMAADNDGALSEAAHQEAASAAGTHFKTHAEDSEEDISAAGIHFMTHAEEDSDADQADCVMLDLDDEMEGLMSAAKESSEGETAGTRVTSKKGEDEATSATAGHDQPSFQAARSSSAEMPGGMVTPPPHREPQPSSAQGLPQSSPNAEEEDLDRNAKHSQEERQPIEAVGLPQSSPNEEELETIAEEPAAESRASLSQSAHPWQLDRRLGNTQQQQEALEKDGEPGTSSAWTTDNQTGSQAQNKWDSGQAKGGAGIAGDPRNVEEEASQHASTEARGEAGHSRSHTAFESSHHSFAGAPGSNTQQELSPHAPEQPLLHSSLGQHAVGDAQHANAGSTNVHNQTAAPSSPQQAAKELPAGEDTAAETEGGVEGRLEGSSGEQAGDSAGPQEPALPALQSGLGQRAASNEGGGQADLHGDAAASRTSSLPFNSHPAEVESNSDSASHFSEQHQVSNTLPIGRPDIFAEPLSSQQQQPAIQQAQAVAHGPSAPPGEERASDATHDFPSQHQMHNTAPADDEQSMFAEPLTSRAPQASGFTPPHGQTTQAASPDSSSSGDHLPAGHEFASQHHVTNQAPHDEQAYSQPLSSDRQEDQSELAQQDWSSSHHDGAPQQFVSSQASYEEHPQAQPLHSNQQRNIHPSTQAAASFASQHNMHNAAPAERSRYAQPLVHDDARCGCRTAAQTSSSSPDQQDQGFAWQRSMQNEAPAEEPGCAEPLTSHRHEDRAEPFPASRGASAGDTQAFPSQHRMHNAAPAGESMYGRALTSEQHTGSSEHGTGLPSDQPSAQGRSHSGDQFTVHEPNSAPEEGLDRAAPAVQQHQPFHAQSIQEGYASEQSQTHGQAEDEGAERHEHGGERESVQGQHSNAEQLHACQQHNEQHQQSLTGTANGSCSGDEVTQGQLSHKASPGEAGEEADKEGDQEADTSVAETEAALAGAQEAQQQAVQSQQEALADERQTLIHLRQDMQQASGGHSGDQVVQKQRSRQASSEEADEEGDRKVEKEGDLEADDVSTAETVSALAGAQEAQQLAAEAQQQALTEQRQSLVQLRQDLQQQSETHSEDQATFSGEHGPVSKPGGSQASVHAQSSPEGYGSEGQPGDESVERQGRGSNGESMQGQHSNAEQLRASQQPNEQHHQSLTGRLFNTLFGNQGQQQQQQQQQATTFEPGHHKSSEGGVRHSQAGSEQQQLAGLGRQPRHGRNGDTAQQQQSPGQAGQETLQSQDEAGGGGNWSLKHQQGVQGSRDVPDEKSSEEADQSLSETEAALASAQEAQQQAVQAQQEALAEERQTLMHLRQDMQQQSGGTMEGAAEATNASSEATTAGETASGTEVALAQAQHAQYEAMLAGETSLNATHDMLRNVREAMQQFYQDAHGEARNEPRGQSSPRRPFGRQPNAPPSQAFHYVQSAGSAHPTASVDQPPACWGANQQPIYPQEAATHQAGDFTHNRPQMGMGPTSAGPPPQTDSYLRHPNSATHDNPSPRHASYDQRNTADAAQPQLQARGPASAQLSTGEPSHAGRDESQAQRQDQPYDMEGRYERPYAGQPSQDWSAGTAPHQPEADQWVSPTEAHARGAVQQQQPNMGSGYDAPLHRGGSEYGANRQGSGYDTHLNSGGSGYDAHVNPGGPGYNARPNTRPSAYDQSYTGGPNQAQPDNSAWTGGIAAASAHQAAPMHHEASHPQTMTRPMPAGYTGTYSIRRRTQHSSDSGTWFEPSSRWQQQRAPQDEPVARLFQQSEPQHSQYGQAPQQEAQLQYEHEHTPLQHQQEVPQRHDFEHAPSQYQQAQPSHDQNQQALAQRDGFQHAPVHYQQSESCHGDSQSQHAPSQYHQPEPGYQYEYRFPDQQPEPRYPQYEHAPSQQQQQPSYDHQHRPPQEQQAQPEHSQYQHTRVGLQSPDQQEAHSQHHQYQHDLPWRQASLQQQDEHTQAHHHQAQPQHEHGERVQPQQVFPQYGQHEQMPFQQQQVQQDREYEHAPSGFHQPQLQHGQYSGEAVTQHQLEMPSHPDEEERHSQQQGGAAQHEVEQYQHARPEQAAPIQAQHGGDAALHQAVVSNSAQSQWRPSQHEQGAPQHERGAGAEKQQQAEPFHEQYEQPSLRHQQAEAHHHLHHEPALQHQQAKPQFKQHHSLESRAHQSPQEDPPAGWPAISDHQQSEPELSQVQQVPSQPASHEDAGVQGSAPDPAASGAERYIQKPAQPDHFEAEQAQRKPAGHAEHPDRQPASQHWQQQQAPLPDREALLSQQQQQQQAEVHDKEGMPPHAHTAAWGEEAAPQKSLERGPSISSSDAPAEHLEADHASSDGAVTTANKAEEAPVEPDSQAKQEVGHDVQEHLPSDIDSPDTATPSLQSDAEAADSSVAVQHAVPHTDDGLEAETAPKEWMKGKEDRPDVAGVHAPQQPGNSEQSSVGGGILSTLISRITGAEPAVSAEDTGAAEAKLDSQAQLQEETPRLQEPQVSAPFDTTRSGMSEGGPPEQEQAEGQQAASQLPFAAQPQAQPQHPVTSHSQEAQEATEWVADSSADIAGLSSGDDRHLSVRPSSLWGPPAGLALTTPSPAAVETASAGQPTPGLDRTAGASSADAVDGVTNNADGLAMDDQIPSGSPCSRPATHAGFAPEALKQPADQLEGEHATCSADGAFANVTEAERAHNGHDSHAVQERGSPGAEQHLPSGTDSPDTGAQAVQSAVDSSAAVFQPASPTNENSVVETLPDEGRGAGEEQGPEEQRPGEEEQQQQQQQQQPGNSEPSSVGGGILSTIISRITGAEPAVSAEDTGAAEAKLNSQAQPQETPRLHEPQVSMPLDTARSGMSEDGPSQLQQAGNQQAASQPHFAAQSQPQPLSQPHSQAAASRSQEAQEVTESAADSSAGLSSVGGRYLSVPPSSLWGPPAQLALNTPSPAAEPAGTERQDPLSTGVDVPEDTGHPQYGNQDQSTQQRVHQPSAVERKGSEGQATEQYSAEEDASMAETEADLARAQRAQREALQTEDVSLQSSRQALLEVREAIQQEQEQGRRLSQEQDQGTLSSMAQSDTGGRQGGELASVQEADKQANDSMLETGAVLSNGSAPLEVDRQIVDTSVAETEAAVAGAQEVQQQAVQAQQEALAEERQTLMHLRQDMQQASGSHAEKQSSSAGDQGLNSTLPAIQQQQQQQQPFHAQSRQEEYGPGQLQTHGQAEGLERQERGGGGDHFTVGDPNAAPESMLDREAPAVRQQQPCHAQAIQEGYGAEQPHAYGQGGGVRQHDGNTEQLPQQPQEQPYRSLTGLLFSTLFGSRDSRQQQHGAPLDSPMDSQGQVQPGTETAQVGPDASDAHRIAEVSLPAGTADADGSARNDQTAYGRPSNRPATRAGFAPGMVNPKPARLRPALPQDWVQAVDERAADSGTPTSAPPLPLPAPNAASIDSPTAAPTPTTIEAAEDHAVAAGAAARQLGSNQPLPLPLREQAGISDRDRMHLAPQADMPAQLNSMATSSHASSGRQQESDTAQAAAPAAAQAMPVRGNAPPESPAPKSAAMLSLEAMIPPPFDTGSPTGSPTLSPAAQSAPSNAPRQSAFQDAALKDFPDTAPHHHPVSDDSGMRGGHATRPPQALAPGDMTPPDPSLRLTPDPSFRRLASAEVQRRIEQTAVDVQQAVYERDGRQTDGRGGVVERASGDALARATGTLKALAAGRSEEAESLSRGLPTHSGTAEKNPSERQVAAMRSVEGSSQAAKAASLERGMQAAFVFATADRAAAILKALAIGKPLDKMQSVPEAAVEGEALPSAHQLFNPGYGGGGQTHAQLDQGDKEPGEATFVAEGSEASFVTAASHAVPAGSVVSDLEYTSLDDEADDELHNEALYNQSDSGIMTRMSSFPFQGVDHPASPFSAPTSNLRNTPFDWGSPTATADAAVRDSAGIVISEAGSEAAWHHTGVPGYASRAEPPRADSERSSPRARFATASGGPSGLVSGQHVRRTSTQEPDIENVNPQAPAAKGGRQVGALTTQSPSVHAASVDAPNQALSEAAPQADSWQTASAAAATPEPGAKPFVSSKVLSEQLFGTGESPQAVTAAKAPVSPFAEASTAAPLAGAGGKGMSSAGAPRPGAVATLGLEEGVSSGVQRLDGTPKDSGNAERVEEALMGTASPFSRPLSSDEVKPLLARLSQTGPTATRKEKEPHAVPQAAAGKTQRRHPEEAANTTGTVARELRLDDEIQPAEASAAVTSQPMATSAPGKQPAPRRVMQETDDGKARFVCCGFGGRKAGSRGRRKT